LDSLSDGGIIKTAAGSVEEGGSVVTVDGVVSRIILINNYKIDEHHK
jgi:hypothetical protein